MRSSNKRSRGNKNRTNRPSGGNIINRVFDSSGPDGKVRGTPQQLIEKYSQLHRDAQLAGDRVAAENFAQHGEHYTRMLAEAQREVDKAREEQEEQNRQRQADRDRERAQRTRPQEDASNGDQSQADDRGQEREADQRQDDRYDSRGRDDQPRHAAEPEYQPRRSRRGGERTDEAEARGESRTDGDSGLVDTPEGRVEQGGEPAEAQPPRRARRPRKPRGEQGGDGGGDGPAQDNPAAAAE